MRLIRRSQTSHEQDNGLVGRREILVGTANACKGCSVVKFAFLDFFTGTTAGVGIH